VVNSNSSTSHDDHHRAHLHTVTVPLHIRGLTLTSIIVTSTTDMFNEAQHHRNSLEDVLREISWQPSTRTKAKNSYPPPSYSVFTNNPYILTSHTISKQQQPHQKTKRRTRSLSVWGGCWMGAAVPSTSSASTLAPSTGCCSTPTR
jgi:hypothetical protein